MTDAQAFNNLFLKTISDTIDNLEALRTLNDRIGQESGLLAAAAARAATTGRADLTVTDFNNASSAITQLLFTFHSGTPTQKSLLFKML